MIIPDHSEKCAYEGYTDKGFSKLWVAWKGYYREFPAYRTGLHNCQDHLEVCLKYPAEQYLHISPPSCVERLLSFEHLAVIETA